MARTDRYATDDVCWAYPGVLHFGTTCAPHNLGAGDADAPVSDRRVRVAVNGISAACWLHARRWRRMGIRVPPGNVVRMLNANVKTDGPFAEARPRDLLTRDDATVNDDMMRVLVYLAEHFRSPGTHRLDTPFVVGALSFEHRVAPALHRLAAADPPYIEGLNVSEATYPVVLTGLTERGWNAVETDTGRSKSFWRDVKVEVLGGVLAGVVVLVVGFFITASLTNWFGNVSDPKAPTNQGPMIQGPSAKPSAESSAVTCSSIPCIPLTIVDTVQGGRDGGVYVRSSPFEVAERLTGVFQGTLIYGICLLDGGFEAVPGERRWVKTPFDFVPGDVAPDGSFSNPPRSRPSPTGSKYGWITADSVGPDDLLVNLPTC